ncbi:hypothetical protein CRE_24402 [Caenorhabditis remanei]|uniref:SPK domain-containing protein n=1 Tax=Caenorhabditis remanei TaxID=31234 RepID=E3MFT6_CAERE|nr:hypothetical protein CRE_24402 [Caenorhabditis remanei]
MVGQPLHNALKHYQEFTEFCVTTALAADKPITKRTLSRTYLAQTKLNRTETFFTKKFEKVAEILFASNYPIETKAKFFFIASMPIIWSNFKERLEAGGDVRYDNENRILSYKSRFTNVEFCGDHRNFKHTGRRKKTCCAHCAEKKLSANPCVLTPQDVPLYPMIPQQVSEIMDGEMDEDEYYEDDDDEEEEEEEEEYDDDDDEPEFIGMVPAPERNVDTEKVFYDFTQYCVEMAQAASKPIAKRTLSRNFGQKINLNRSEKFFSYRFDKVIQNLFNSDHSFETQAKVFFVTSTPVVWQDFRDEMEKSGEVRFDTEWRILSYKSRISGMAFDGEHRRYKSAGPKRRKSKNGTNGLGVSEVEEEEAEDYDVIEEGDEDTEYLQQSYNVTSQQPNTLVSPKDESISPPAIVPAPVSLWDQRANEPFCDEYGRPLEQFPWYQQEVPPPIVQGNHSGYSTNFMGPSSSGISSIGEETPIESKPPVMQVEPGFVTRKRESTDVLGGGGQEAKRNKWMNEGCLRDAAGTPAESVQSGISSSSSLPPSIPPATVSFNHYAKFLREIYLFFGETLCSFDPNLKKEYLLAENENVGMNIKPSTIKSYLEVYLNEICYEKNNTMENVISLKNLLAEFNQMAKHFGEGLTREIVPVVGELLEDTKDEDMVSKSAILVTIGKMTDGLKKCAKPVH